MINTNRNLTMPAVKIAGMASSIDPVPGRNSNAVIASPTSSLEALSDADLASRVVGGARDAFNQLVIRYERRLFRFLAKNAATEADAEDAMQEALVKAYINLHRYNPRWQFTTWLYTIALRELRTIGRKKKLRPTSLAQAQDHAAPATPDPIDGAELWSAAKRLLTSQQYTALWLRFGEDLQARDIAKVMKRPRVWVSVTIHRACAVLRQSFSPDLEYLATDSPE